MKAVVYTRYGPPDVLRLTDVPSPVPKDGEVLVQVHAVSLNAIATVIDRRYRLDEVPEALRYLGEGHAQGKVVVILE
jgi:NADPH:quinone reductase-like Zn-dependent oxidoreductase